MRPEFASLPFLAVGDERNSCPAQIRRILDRGSSRGFDGLVRQTIRRTIRRTRSTVREEVAKVILDWNL